MIYENNVAWLEGMFLQPHHFQQMNQYYEALIHRIRKVYSQNYWGISELRIDEALLPLRKISIQSAKGIFSDGSVFNIPAKDLKPDPIELSDEPGTLTLYLAIALKSNAAELGDASSKESYRNFVEVIEVRDLTADTDNRIEIQIKKLKPVILTSKDDLSRFSYIKFAEVNIAGTEANVSFDEKIIPTCIDIKTSNKLSQSLNLFQGLLSHRAQALAQRLTDPKNAGSTEMIDLILLQLMNRYEVIIQHLKTKEGVHPETYFRYLIQLLAELQTFTQNNRRPEIKFHYKHQDLNQTFDRILEALKQALSTILEQNAIAISLKQRSDGLWVTQLEDTFLITTYQFVLAVYADLPLEEIRNNCPMQTKIAPLADIMNLIKRQLPGIEIKPVAVVPRQIPYHSNFCYFYIETENRFWQNLNKTTELAIHFAGSLPNLKVELWAIKGL